MRQKQDNTKDVREEQEHLSDFMGDIGNFDLPDLDLNLVDFLPSDETEETRYTLPKVVPMKEDFVMYDNAQKMAKELRLGFGGDTPTTVIDCDKPKKNPDHPTMKPVPLIGKLISNSSRRKDIVLDIFGGSGTTLIAAEQLGRCCRMVEFEPIYVDVIIKRWEELTGMKAFRIGNIHAPQPEQPAATQPIKTKAKKEG